MYLTEWTLMCVTWSCDVTLVPRISTLHFLTFPADSFPDLKLELQMDLAREHNNCYIICSLLPVPKRQFKTLYSLPAL